MSKVWIVDDDSEMRSAIELMLKLMSFETRGFAAAREAAQALLAEPLPDILVLDINMPEVSGLDMLEFVRRRPDWNRMPVLMLSTEAADVTVDRALALGADGYVTKPATMEELERALKLALQKSKKGAT